jgi:branched-chain amino acid transport system ATP-binding protein
VNLHLQDVHVHYGPVHALRGIDVHVRTGEIVALIGANGAGKSTMMTTIMGAQRLSAGCITFGGKDLSLVAPHKIPCEGLALSPEGRRVFPRMTVLENLQVGATYVAPAHRAADLEYVFTLFPVLEERLQQRAGTLSGGEQQMLAIGRALVSRPRLLLLDEPSLGLAPIYVRRIFQIVEELNRRDGMTVLLVEQNAHHALRLAHTAHVLQNGRITLSGSGQDLLNSPDVKSAYLSGEPVAPAPCA